MAPIYGSRAASSQSNMLTNSAGAVCILFMAIPTATSQVLHCEQEGQPTEWLQASLQTSWREWDGKGWGPALCGRQLEDSQQVERWECRFGRRQHVLTYTAIDRRSGGVYRRVETLEVHSGQYRRRIIDGAHVPDGGKRLVLEFRGRCEVWEGAVPIDEER